MHTKKKKKVTFKKLEQEVRRNPCDATLVSS